MKAIKVHLIAAARPNVMKVAPLYHALKNEAWCEPILVHTGQHYDANSILYLFVSFRIWNWYRVFRLELHET